MQVPEKTTGFGPQLMPGDASGKKSRKNENLFVKIEPSSRITDDGYTARLGTHFEIKGRELLIQTEPEGEIFKIPLFDVLEFIGACALTKEK